WELDEAWRELLAAQHHDNDECEGLCGHVGLTSYRRSAELSRAVFRRTADHIANRAASQPGETLAFNMLGWPRDIAVQNEDEEPPRTTFVVPRVPAMGYTVVDAGSSVLRRVAPPQIRESPDGVSMRRRDVTVTVDRAGGFISQITSAAFPNGL